jgi:phosphatidylglycerophosphate synthase
VTVLGLLVAGAAAYGIALGSYWPAVAGALLYYLSTLLDCCDGEVARCTFRTSVFGGWLNTVSDYASTFLILAGTLVHVLTNATRADRQATWLAVIGTTITVTLLAYRRRRVIGHDPDAFERTLGRAVPFRRQRSASIGSGGAL